MSDLEDIKNSDGNKCVNPLYLAKKRTQCSKNIDLNIKNNLIPDINKLNINFDSKSSNINDNDSNVIDINIGSIENRRLPTNKPSDSLNNAGTSETIRNEINNISSVLATKTLSVNNINSIDNTIIKSTRYSFERYYHSENLQKSNNKIQYNNCPEKIIFCIDIAESMTMDNFETLSGDKFTRISLIRRALRFFLHSKTMMNSAHQFALIFLSDTIIWMCDFTSDINKILTILENYNEFLPVENTCDFNKIFEIMSNLQMVKNMQKLSFDPYYCIRLIIIYTRSDSMPTFDKKVLAELFNKELLFIDVLYLYDSNDAACEKIYRRLCELDIRNEISYMFSVCKKPTKLYESFSRLLSHPLQRCHQQKLCES